MEAGCPVERPLATDNRQVRRGRDLGKLCPPASLTWTLRPGSDVGGLYQVEPRAAAACIQQNHQGLVLSKARQPG